MSLEQNLTCSRLSDGACKLSRDTTVSWTSEVEEKLRVARV